MPNRRSISVFIASPGDVVQERTAFRQTLDDLNSGFGDGYGVTFDALGWEDVAPLAGPRSQDLINQEVDRCDVFVLVMYRTWGRPAPDSDYASYTEEEFQRALKRWNRDPGSGNERTPTILVFFRRVDPGQEADPGPQLTKVLRFKRAIEASRHVLYRRFDDERQFARELDQNLRAFARGEMRLLERQPVSILPISVLEQIETAQQEAKHTAETAEEQVRSAVAAKDGLEIAKKRAAALAARADELALALAKQAATAAESGRAEEARQLFALAHQDTTNLHILSAAFDFYFRTGDLVAAQEVTQRWLAISGPASESSDTAAAMLNLGLIAQARGDFARAEDLFQRALKNDDRQQGKAAALTSLGILYRDTSRLDEAEMAIAKAIDIEKGTNSSSLAANLSNLGNVYFSRRNYDRAEALYREAKTINEKPPVNKEFLAANLGNLGVIYRSRNQLDEAERFLKDAIKLDKEINDQRGVAIFLGHLGMVHRDRGDLTEAERMCRESLKIHEIIDDQLGVANQLSNLGLLAGDANDAEAAERLWKQAHDIYAKIGLRKGEEHAQKQLSQLALFSTVYVC